MYITRSICNCIRVVTEHTHIYIYIYIYLYIPRRNTFPMLVSRRNARRVRAKNTLGNSLDHPYVLTRCHSFLGGTERANLNKTSLSNVPCTATHALSRQLYGVGLHIDLVLPVHK